MCCAVRRTPTHRLAEPIGGMLSRLVDLRWKTATDHRAPASPSPIPTARCVQTSPRTTRSQATTASSRAPTTTNDERQRAILAGEEVIRVCDFRTVIFSFRWRNLAVVYVCTGRVGPASPTLRCLLSRQRVWFSTRYTEAGTGASHEQRCWGDNYPDRGRSLLRVFLGRDCALPAFTAPCKSCKIIILVMS